MNKLTIFFMLIVIFIFCIYSCGKEDQIASKYLRHVKNVYSIILNNPEDSNAAAGEVYEYVEKNKKQIEQASSQLKQLTVRETEKVYPSIVQEIQKLIEYIKSHTTDAYPLASEEKLGTALQFLLK